MSGPIPDEGLFIPHVVIHSTKQFAQKILKMLHSNTETSEGPDYRYLMIATLHDVNSYFTNTLLLGVIM